MDKSITRCILFLLTLFFSAASLFLSEGVFADSAHSSHTEVKKVDTSQVEKEIEELTTQLRNGRGEGGAGGSVGTLGGSTSQLVELSKKRKELMEELAEKNPQAFLFQTMSPDERKKFPAQAQKNIEQRVKVSGSMSVFHIDDFKNPKNSRFEYKVKTSKGELDFYPIGNPPALVSGSVVAFDGFQIGTTLVALGGEGGLTVESTPPPESVGRQATLFILVTADGLPTPPSKEEMHKQMFSGNFQAFYRQQSYGLVSFYGTTTDWITVPRNDVSWCGSPGLEHPEIQRYFRSKNIDLTYYTRVMFVTNNQSGGCASVGKVDSEVGGKMYKLSFGWSGYVPELATPGTLNMWFEKVLAHEMGHQLGVMHANSWNCTGTSLEAGCEHREYGNMYDTMGYGNGHFNAFYKDRLGWLPATSKYTVTQDGLVTLSPYELGSGVRALLIQNPSTPLIPPLYVEYRQRIGFDRTLPDSGVGLHLNQSIHTSNSDHPFSRLLNANYRTQTQDSYALPRGGSFVWPSRGISVNNLTTSSSSALFGIDFTDIQCSRSEPEFSKLPLNAEVAPGGGGSISFHLINTDTAACSSRVLELTASIRNGDDWIVGVYPSEATTVFPGDTIYAHMWFSPPEEISLMTYTLDVSARDVATGQVISKSIQVDITEPPVITSVSPSQLSVGDTLTLRGEGFGGFPNWNGVYLFNSSILAGAYIPSIESQNGSELSFVIPNKLFRDYSDPNKGTPGDSEDSTIPTPDGDYQGELIRLSDGSRDAFSFSVVSDNAPDPCILDGITVPSGSSSKFYRYQSVNPGAQCAYRIRTCTDGTLSGDSIFRYASCTVGTIATMTTAAPKILTLSYYVSPSTSDVTAVPGDYVSVAFSTDVSVRTPVVSIANRPAVVRMRSGSDKLWSASMQMTAQDPLGRVPFSVELESLSGVKAALVTDATRNVSVTLQASSTALF